MAFPSGYTKYQVVTIDNTKVPGDLTDFVVYVDLSELSKAGADIFDTCRSDGGDIRVTKSDGTTELPREVVAIDTTAKTGVIHIKFTGTLSSSSDTVIRIWYNGTDTEPAASATYGSQNVWTGYDLVAHCIEDPSGTAPQILDSTANGFDGTSAGSMTSGDSVAGKLANNALDFDGSNDTVTFGASGSDLDAGNEDVYVSTWFKLKNTTAAYGIATKNAGSPSSSPGYHAYNSGTTMYSKVANGTSALNGQQAGLNTTDWFFFTMEWDDSAGTLHTFLNDNLADSDSASIGSFSTTAYKFAIASRGGFLFAPAYIQEVRVKIGSGGVKSEDWHDTQFANQDSPATFYSTGDEQETAGGSEQNSAFLAVL